MVIEEIGSDADSVSLPTLIMPDEQVATPGDAGPVPLSFPAILRNPKLSDRFAHLQVLSQPEDPSHQGRTKKDRPEPEGKRWVRRRENGALRRRSPSPPALTRLQPGSLTIRTLSSRLPPTWPTHCSSPRLHSRTLCLLIYPAPFPFLPLALPPPTPTHPPLASSPSPCVVPAALSAPAPLLPIL